MLDRELDKTVEDVWQRVIAYSLSMGGVLLLFVAIRDIVEGHYADSIINIGFYVTFVVILLTRRVPFPIRQLLVISLTFGLAAREYLLHALNPDSVFFLITGIALVALTKGPRIGFIVIGGVLLFIPAASYLRSSGSLVEMGINASREDELRLVIAYMLEAALYCSILNYMIGTLIHRAMTESTERIRSLQRERERDIENRRLEEQVNQSQKMDAVGRLAGGVAHDLNNLLTPVLGYADLILRDESLTPESRSGAEQVVYAANSARELVQQLLTFSRKQETRMEAIDFNAMIDSFRNLAQFTLRENVEFIFRPGEEVPVILGDRNKIEQVIMNLLLNGQDAMPKGGTITFSTNTLHIDESSPMRNFELDAGDYLVIQIKDTGEGIEEEVQSKIFDPFFSTKGAQGTGLGLSIAYGIIQQHRGHIEVSSTPNAGTTFTIYLPAFSKKTHPNECLPKEQKVNPSPTSPSKTVLLAEDNQQIRKLTHLILTRCGHHALVARDGVEALSIAESFNGPIDLLLTDVIMPGMNGTDLYESVQKHYPDIRVIFMSGYTDKGIIDLSKYEQAAFVQKPFTAQTLQDSLADTFE